MTPKRLERTIGNWVVGDKFWGRERELGLFIEDLDRGAHLLLTAQRRIGKTSLMREAARRIANRYVCLHVDLQRCHSAADAITELGVATREYQSLWNKTKGVFSNILSNTVGQIDSLQLADVKVTLRSGLTVDNWQEKGDRILDILAESELPVAIFFDEVPILVNRLLKGDDYQITPERCIQADTLMSWFRANSVKHQEKVRMVMTGSIGLEPVLSQGELSATINTFQPFDLGAWSPATAQECLQALANQYGLTFVAGTPADMVDCLGVCIPYHVQLFFDSVYKTCRLRDLKVISQELVAEVYETNMLSVRGHAELSHMEERLKLVLGPELHPLALTFLTEAAVVGELTLSATQILIQDFVLEGQERNPTDITREVLRILEHDGYLRRNSGGYQFESRLLKDWWEARNGFHFVIAADRREDNK